jgi:hypothetical protein
MWDTGGGRYHRPSLYEDQFLAVQQGSVPNSTPKEEAMNHQYKLVDLSYNKHRQAAYGMKANINNKNVAKMKSKCTEWTKQLIT